MSRAGSSKGEGCPSHLEHEIAQVVVLGGDDTLVVTSGASNAKRLGSFVCPYNGYILRAHFGSISATASGSPSAATIDLEKGSNGVEEASIATATTIDFASKTTPTVVEIPVTTRKVSKGDILEGLITVTSGTNMTYENASLTLAIQPLPTY